jgi:hypothetical protein
MWIVIGNGVGNLVPPNDCRVMWLVWAKQINPSHEIYGQILVEVCQTRCCNVWFFSREMEPHAKRVWQEIFVDISSGSRGQTAILFGVLSQFHSKEKLEINIREYLRMQALNLFARRKFKTRTKLGKMHERLSGVCWQIMIPSWNDWRKVREKDRNYGENEEEGVSSYWMTLRKRDDTGNWKRKH